MIRFLSPEQHAIYRRIRVEALSADPGAFGETLAAIQSRSDSDLVQWLSQAIVPERKAIAYIEEQGHCVAMCGFRLSDEDKSIGAFWGMFVSPPHRRKGYGRLLLEAAESWISEHDGGRVLARVAAPNDSAITFYRSCGYSIGGQKGTLRPGSNIPVYEICKMIQA